MTIEDVLGDKVVTTQALETKMGFGMFHEITIVLGDTAAIIPNTSVKIVVVVRSDEVLVVLIFAAVSPRTVRAVYLASLRATWGTGCHGWLSKR